MSVSLSLDRHSAISTLTTQPGYIDPPLHPRGALFHTFQEVSENEKSLWEATQEHKVSEAGRPLSFLK